MKASNLRIIVTGLIGQHYSLAGVTWDYIQYVIGLKKLGHEVYYLEDTGEWPYNLEGGRTGNDWVAPDCSRNIAHLDHVFKKFDLGVIWGYRYPVKNQWFGLPSYKRKDLMKNADLLINVSGTLEKPEKYEIKNKLYIDSDPGFTQIKIDLGYKEFSKRVAAHNMHFSFGEKINTIFQNTGYNWKPTRSPIVLDLWTNFQKEGKKYTTIMNWTSYKPLHYDNSIYGQKDMEFIKFLDLPGLCPDIYFEIALSETQHKNWQSLINDSDINNTNRKNLRAFDKPKKLLHHYGWHVVSPQQRCRNIEDYRTYIQNSRAEWSVAKGGYVLSQAGWFSCRSSCYLASARPVVVQNTGLSDLFPIGEGLLSFENPSESVQAIEAIESNYGYHSQKARELADAFFCSDKILTNLIQQAFE